MPHPDSGCDKKRMLEFLLRKYFLEKDIRSVLKEHSFIHGKIPSVCCSCEIPGNISRAFFLSHCWHHNCNNLSFFEIFLLWRFLFSLPPPLNLVACCQIWKRERSISFVQKYFCQLISKYFPSTTTYFFLQNNSYSSNLVWHFDWDHLDSRICGC